MSIMRHTKLNAIKQSKTAMGEEKDRARKRGDFGNGGDDVKKVYFGTTNTYTHKLIICMV